jgi:glyoxylase-like metal-dependent hydrolase (beta-lactamase superfamily II)
MDVAPGIHRVDTQLGDRVNSLYLLVGDDRTLLFDVGVDGVAEQDLRPYMERNGIALSSLRHAVISHADVDHFGGLASLRELAPHAVVAAHVEDAALIEDYAVYEDVRARGFREPWEVDEDPATLAWTREVTREGLLDLHLRGGERIRLGADWTVEVLHAAGHSRGHLSVWDERSRSLLVSDAVLAEAVLLADGTPAFPPTYRFVDDYLATIARFESLRPERLLTAHYPTMDRDDATAFLARSRTFADGLEAAIVDTVDAAGADGLDLPSILAELNPTVGSWPSEGTAEALAFPVVGHLERLLRQGRIGLVRDSAPARVRSRR